MLKLWGIFMLNGMKRIIICFLIVLVLLYLDLIIFIQCQQNKVSDSIIFQSDLLQTDGVGLSENIYNAYWNGNKDAALDAKTDIPELLHQQKCVGKVYGFDNSVALFQDSEVMVKTAYPETYDLISKGIHLSSGSWFRSSEPSDNIRCVVGGAYFSDVNVGDQIALTVCDEFTDYQPGGTIFCTVAGKVDFPYHTVYFSQYVNEAHQLVVAEHDNVVYLLHDDKTVSEMEDKGFVLTAKSNTLFVKYRENASKADIDSFRRYINNYFKDPEMNVENITKLGTGLTEDTEIFDNFAFLRNKYFLSSYPFVVVLVSVVLISLVMSASNSPELKIKKSTNLFSVVMTDVLLVTLPMIILFFYLFMAQFSRISSHASASLKSELLNSSQMTEEIIFLLIIWLLTIMLTMIAPIVKMIRSWKDTSKTQDAYTYREPEYYHGYDEEEK